MFSFLAPKATQQNANFEASKCSETNECHVSFIYNMCLQATNEILGLKPLFQFRL